MKFVMILMIGNMYVSATHAMTRDWRFSVTDSVTRCFESKNIRAHCEEYAENDETTLREELQIEAVDYMGREFSYSYEKAIEGSLCRNHLRKIQKLMKNVDQACITGEREMRFKDGETLSRWTALETRRGELVW